MGDLTSRCTIGRFRPCRKASPRAACATSRSKNRVEVLQRGEASTSRSEPCKDGARSSEGCAGGSGAARCPLRSARAARDARWPSTPPQCKSVVHRPLRRRRSRPSGEQCWGGAASSSAKPPLRSRSPHRRPRRLARESPCTRPENRGTSRRTRRLRRGA